MKIAIAILFLFVVQAKAVELVTDRPDQTESASIVPANSLQIESGFLLEQVSINSINERNILLPTTLFRYGLFDRIELRVLNQFESYSLKYSGFSCTSYGFSDIEIGLKVQLLSSESATTEIALLSHVVLPTGSEGFTNDKYGSISKLAIAHSISENVGVGYNIGYDYFGDGNGNLTYSLAIGFVITSNLGLFIETYGEYSDMDENFSNIDTGMTYLLEDNLQLDFSFGTGLNHDMNYMSFGFSWLIYD